LKNSVQYFSQHFKHLVAIREVKGMFPASTHILQPVGSSHWMWPLGVHWRGHCVCGRL